MERQYYICDRSTTSSHMQEGFTGCVFPFASRDFFCTSEMQSVQFFFKWFWLAKLTHDRNRQILAFFIVYVKNLFERWLPLLGSKLELERLWLFWDSSCCSAIAFSLRFPSSSAGVVSVFLMCWSHRPRIAPTVRFCRKYDETLERDLNSNYALVSFVLNWRKPMKH